MSNPISRAVLVTGGAGYIGSQTAARLNEAGYLPVVLDNLSTGHRENVKWGPFHLGDISDSKIVSEICDTYEPIGAIHFAGSAYVGESVENPFKYFENNTAKSAQLIGTLSSCGVHNLVFSSTCATYGEPSVDRISESQVQTPINPYGVSKLLVEKILLSASSVSQLRFVALRYFNAAGGDPEYGLLENHNPETHLLPILIRAASEGLTFRVNGGDYQTADGSPVRDFIHIRDLADAHVKALEYLVAGGSSEFINLGSGNGTSIFELIDKVQTFGYELKVEIGSRRPGDPAKLVADPTKAKKLLNWETAYSSVENILESAGLQRK